MFNFLAPFELVTNDGNSVPLGPGMALMLEKSTNQLSAWLCRRGEVSELLIRQNGVESKLVTLQDLSEDQILQQLAYLTQAAARRYRELDYTVGPLENKLVALFADRAALVVS